MLVSDGFISATSIPGTRRRISGIVAAPDMRISSSLMMVNDAGVFASDDERALAVTTCSSKMSSAVDSARAVPPSSCAISLAVAFDLALIVSASNMSSSAATAGLASFSAGFSVTTVAGLAG